MVKKVTFRIFKEVYPRFLGFGLLIFVPLCVFTDTLFGNTDGLDQTIEDTWETMSDAWNLMLLGRTE
jgi:hypothetical protein